MLVFALLYGVRPSSNGPHFAELEDEERRMSTHSLVMHLPRVPGARPGLVSQPLAGPGPSRGREKAPSREPPKTPLPCSASYFEVTQSS